jgi:hypothetical protein
MPIVEFDAEDGATVLVKVTETGDGLVTRGLGGGSELVERAEKTFGAALRPIRTVADGVLAQLSAIPRQPDEVSVDFGLELTANSSAILVGASGAASVRVHLTWTAAHA